MASTRVGARSASTTSLVGTLWVTVSALLSTWANGTFLSIFHDPFAHTFFRYALASAVALPYAFIFSRPLLARLPHLARRLIVPSLLLLVANTSYSMSIHHTGITLTSVLMGLIPAFTVAACRWRGDQFEPSVYVTLVPTCLGVTLASADAAYSGFGVLCALVAALSTAVLNIVSKDTVANLKVSGVEAFLVICLTNTILSAPLLLFAQVQVPTLWRACWDADGERVRQVVALLGLTFFTEQVLSFILVRLTSPLAFSVSDIVRRLSTVLVGAALFHRPLSWLNMVGVVISCMGAAAYSVVTKRPSRKPETLLAKGVPDLEWPGHYAAVPVRGFACKCVPSIAEWSDVCFVAPGTSC